MTPQQKAVRQARMKEIIVALKKLFPKTGIALQYSNDWELVVAVILSAQTTDKKVNEVTRDLFKKYPTLESYTSATNHEFTNDIKQIGLFRGKAKNILALAKIIKEKYDGKLPNDIDTLVELPGIGRKTATVIMNVAHNNPVGITVDTHVRRYAIRFDLSDFKDPARIEKDLMEITPQEEWGDLTFRLIEYGRQICPARSHECTDHPLTKIYPHAAKIWPKAK